MPTRKPAPRRRKAAPKRAAARKSNARSHYEVVVGNIGTVYSGASLAAAKKDYKTYVAQSVDGRGRAAGESVTLFKNGEIDMEHLGSQGDDGGDY